MLKVSGGSYIIISRWVDLGLTIRLKIHDLKKSHVQQYSKFFEFGHNLIFPENQNNPIIKSEKHDQIDHKNTDVLFIKCINKRAHHHKQHNEVSLGHCHNLTQLFGGVL